MASNNYKAYKKQESAPKKGKLSKKAKRIIVIVSVSLMALLLILGVLLVVLSGKREDYRILSKQKEVVATCNGFDISYDELYFVTQLYKDTLEFSYGEGIWDNPETAEKYRAELEELVMENLHENALILTACRDLSIPIDSDTQKEYVNTQMDKMMNEDYGGDRERMLQALEDDGISERYMRYLIGVEYLHSSIYYTLSDIGYYTYTESNLNEFMDYVANDEHYARTLHAFVENDPGEDVEANRQKAQNMCDYLNAETDVAAREALMREYIGSANNEDLQITEYGYYFTHGEMDEAYEAATFDLLVGEISEVVETTDGFYVIMRLTPDPDYIPRIAMSLLKNYWGVAMGAFIDNRVDQCTVTFNEYGKSLDLVHLEQYRVTEPSPETQAPEAKQ